MTPVNTPEFAAIFRDLVVALQPRTLDRNAQAVYAAALQRYPLDVLQASATILAATQRFFPTTAEWARAASAIVRRQRPGTIPGGECERCLGYGLLRVDYRSGEPFDVAMCTCRAGQQFRIAGDDFVRLRHHLSDEHRVAWLEDFDEAYARLNVSAW